MVAALAAVFDVVEVLQGGIVRALLGGRGGFMLLRVRGSVVVMHAGGAGVLALLACFVRIFAGGAARFAFASVRLGLLNVGIGVVIEHSGAWLIFMFCFGKLLILFAVF